MERLANGFKRRMRVSVRFSEVGLLVVDDSYKIMMVVNVSMARMLMSMPHL